MNASVDDGGAMLPTPMTYFSRRNLLLACAGLCSTLQGQAPVLPLEVSLDRQIWWSSDTSGFGLLGVRVNAASNLAGHWYTVVCDPWIQAGSTYFSSGEGATELMQQATSISFHDALMQSTLPRSNNDNYTNHESLVVPPLIATSLLAKATFNVTVPADRPHYFGDPLWYGGPNGARVIQEFGLLPTQRPSWSSWDTDALDNWIALINPDGNSLDYILEGLIQRWTWRKVAPGTSPADFEASTAWKLIEAAQDKNELWVTLQAIGVRSRTVDPNTVPSFSNQNTQPPKLNPYPLPSVPPTYVSGIPLRIQFTGAIDPALPGPYRRPLFHVTAETPTPRTARAGLPVVVQAAGYHTGLEVRLRDTTTFLTYDRLATFAGFGKWRFTAPNLPVGRVFKLVAYRYPRPTGGYYPWQAQAPNQQATWQIVP